METVTDDVWSCASSRSPPLVALTVTTVVNFDFHEVPGGDLVVSGGTTVNAAGIAMRTQPRSSPPVGPPRFENVTSIVVGSGSLDRARRGVEHPGR